MKMFWNSSRLSRHDKVRWNAMCGKFGRKRGGDLLEDKQIVFNHTIMGTSSFEVKQIKQLKQLLFHELNLFLQDKEEVTKHCSKC